MFSISAGEGIRYGTDTMLKKYQGGGPSFVTKVFVYPDTHFMTFV